MYDTGWTVDLRADMGGRSTPELPSIAAFSATVLADLHVGFADESSDVHGATITGWLWDFDDGQTSALQNPNHLYAAGGLYTVRLTITNSFGTESSIEHDVTPNAPPLSTFTFVVVAGEPIVTFTDTSTDPDDGIGAWDWDFGDGQTSHVRHPVHTYAAIGVYVVTLKVWDVLGGQNLTTHNVTIVAARRFPASLGEWVFYFPTVPVPTAIFTCQEANGNLADGMGGPSLIAAGSPLYHQSGDPLGRYSVGSAAAADGFRMASNTNFDVSAIRSLSAFYRFAQPHVASVYPLVAGKNNTSDNVGLVPYIAYTGSFNAQIKGANGVTVTATVPGSGATAHDDGNYHDGMHTLDGVNHLIKAFTERGTSSSQSVAGVTSASCIAKFGFGAQTPGTYAGLRVSYLPVWVGVVLTQTHFDTIRTPTLSMPYVSPVSPPVSAFTFVVADRTVTFTDGSSDPNGTVVTWAWDFGDGGTSSVQNPVHVYAAAGVYPVRLIVTDNSGAQTAILHDVTIVAIRRFPANGTEWAFYFPTVPVPTAIFGCQEAASPLADGIAGVTLAAAGAPLFRQAGDPTGRYSVKASGSTSRFSAASAATLDIPNGVTSASAFVRYACPAVAGYEGAPFGKRGGTGSTGYDIFFGVGPRSIRSVYDGGATETDAVLNGNYDDGQFHDACQVADRVAQLNRFFVDGNSVTNTALSSIGTLTSTAVYSLLGDSVINSVAGLLVSYNTVWIGTALTQAQFDIIRTPC
jgi:PKD repeat protein